MTVTENGVESATAQKRAFAPSHEEQVGGMLPLCQATGTGWIAEMQITKRSCTHLADARVPDEEELEEVIVAFGHRVSDFWERNVQSGEQGRAR